MSVAVQHRASRWLYCIRSTLHRWTKRTASATKLEQALLQDVLTRRAEEYEQIAAGRCSSLDMEKRLEQLKNRIAADLILHDAVADVPFPSLKSNPRGSVLGLRTRAATPPENIIVPKGRGRHKSRVKRQSVARLRTEEKATRRTALILILFSICVCATSAVAQITAADLSSSQIASEQSTKTLEPIQNSSLIQIYESPSTVNPGKTRSAGAALTLEELAFSGDDEVNLVVSFSQKPTSHRSYWVVIDDLGHEARWNVHSGKVWRHARGYKLAANQVTVVSLDTANDLWQPIAYIDSLMSEGYFESQPRPGLLRAWVAETPRELGDWLSGSITRISDYLFFAPPW